MIQFIDWGNLKKLSIKFLIKIRCISESIFSQSPIETIHRIESYNDFPNILR